MLRPYNTLFLLTSVDGKISTGLGDGRDFDKDLSGIVDGLDAYYEAEKSTDYFSMISGNIAMKLGADNGEFIKSFHQCAHVLMDCARLTDRAIDHIAKNCERLILVTDDVRRYSEWNKASYVDAVYVSDLHDIFTVMSQLYLAGVKSMTIQTGGTLNSAFLRAKVIDRVDLFVAPIIVGGSGVHSISDGEPIIEDSDLNSISKLDLIATKVYASGIIRNVFSVKDVVGESTGIGYTIQ